MCGKRIKTPQTHCPSVWGRRVSVYLCVRDKWKLLLVSHLKLNNKPNKQKQQFVQGEPLPSVLR